MPIVTYMNKHSRHTQKKFWSPARLKIHKTLASLGRFKNTALRESSHEPPSLLPSDSSNSEDMVLSDTESDNCFEVSCNESISSDATNVTSSADSISSTNFWNQNCSQQSDSSPVVITNCTVLNSTVTLCAPSVIYKKLTYIFKNSEVRAVEEDYLKLKHRLTDILKNCQVQNAEETCSILKHRLTYMLKRCQVRASKEEHSKLEHMPKYEHPPARQARAWSSIPVSFSNDNLLSHSRQDCGRVVSKDVSLPSKIKSDNNVESDSEKEPDRFFESETGHCDVLDHKNISRIRDYRVNNTFLRRYALDYSARMNQLLPNNPEDVKAMIRIPSLRKFDQEYGLYKFSKLSRKKVWRSENLPPRTDEYPRRVIDSSDYVRFQSDRSPSQMFKQQTSVLGATRRTFVKPAGRFRSSNCVKSESSPTLTKSIPQYTVRGWQNKRWIPITISSQA